MTKHIVPRRVVRLRAEGEEQYGEMPIESLGVYRDAPAWVLLGEPGAGKTEAFEREAEATSAVYRTVAEFVAGDVDPDWQSKTLFLDALDEVRGGGGGTTLHQVAAQLKRLSKPRFRISCRAADWYGQMDAQTLTGLTETKELTVLVLQPLGESEIVEVLEKNHQVPDGSIFVHEAKRRGLQELLGNPQTLDLLARAVRVKWPESRSHAFEFAAKTLAKETNRAHREKRSDTPEQLVEAVGYLSALMLLGNCRGIALDEGVATSYYPALAEMGVNDLNLARAAVRSRLFRQSASSEERVEPLHRSIAEFLAARWVVASTASGCLPSGRLMKVLLGRDGRVVAGLRGLYGWMATLSGEMGDRFIADDPLTVVLYGDVQSMPAARKRSVLGSLRHEVERNIAFRSHLPGIEAFGGLSDPALVDDFRQVLQVKERDRVTQSFAYCVLEILDNGQPLPELVPDLMDCVRDPSWWPICRQTALDAWIKNQSGGTLILGVLDEITAGAIVDDDDELAGRSLRTLYPAHLPTNRLLDYCHPPKDPNLIGAYRLFFEYDLPERVPARDLPELLDQLSSRSDWREAGDERLDLSHWPGRLLVRGITECGDSASPERIYGWIGLDPDTAWRMDPEGAGLKKASEWFARHPDVYKSVLAYGLDSIADRADPWPGIYEVECRLRWFPVPPDLGAWHLERAGGVSNEGLVRHHLLEATRLLANRRCDVGLTLEGLEAFRDVHPEWKDFIDGLLFVENRPEDAEHRVREGAWRAERAENRKRRGEILGERIDEVRTGLAAAYVMYELALVWAGFHHDARGQTPAERLASFCNDDGGEVLSAVEEGFERCIDRSDLPEPDSTFALHARSEHPLMTLPCLLGMDLRWQRDPGGIDMLADETLSRMIAFQLVLPTVFPDSWFEQVVGSRPDLVADVYLRYARCLFRTKRDYLSYSRQIENEEDFAPLAKRVVPALLLVFPRKARRGQLSCLASLLKAALRRRMPELEGIIASRIERGGMDVGQTVYWHVTAMLVSPRDWQDSLWRYVGHDGRRIGHLSAFLDEEFGESEDPAAFSAETLARLIELLLPHADLDWASGIVTPSKRRGDQLRGLVKRLTAIGDEKALAAIESLIARPGMDRLDYMLASAREETRVALREREYRFPDLDSITTVLSGGPPVGVDDLQTLGLEFLDEIAERIRGGNEDRNNAFWDMVSPPRPRKENLCRDTLLQWLRPYADQYGILCDPESDYRQDKRADITLFFGATMKVPIEIKVDRNREVWSGLRDQLIGQYACASEAAGYGIYLVLWFGRRGLPGAPDGGAQPRSAAELRARLEALLEVEERGRIAIRVLDVSRP